ncbi:MAG: enoyl-CoA hydratase/isomerase family protein [Thauera sp.]|nr:enoyl-CoA hydratase/isomerase family protein [Thauera sp.]
MLLPETEPPASVLVDIIDGVGVLTLNRPAVLNALDLATVRALTRQLDAWADDPAIRAVLLRGTGERAFCAGGDVCSLYHLQSQGSPELERYFDEEYALDCRIHRYPKPTIALMDGVVMGGGMGISQGCTHRLVTERTRMAMPETAIGVFPDVGGSYFLSRLRSAALGVYIGVVGDTLSGADAVVSGLADRLVPSAFLADLPALIAAIDAGAWPAAPTHTSIPSLLTAPVLAAVERHFCQPGVEEILASLAGETDPALRTWVERTLGLLAQRSPLMLRVTFEQLRRGRQLDLEACFRMERTMVAHSFAHGDTMEGIRALLIDKDRSPRWRHRAVAEVPREEVEDFFAGHPP